MALRSEVGERPGFTWDRGRPGRFPGSGGGCGSMAREVLADT